MAGPGDEMAVAGCGGRGELRASHADRELVIRTLKAAFVEGMLGKDEFDQRVAQTFGSRTCAELAALTDDLRVAPVEDRPPEPARAPTAGPVLRSGPVTAVATALCGSVWALAFLPPWPLNSEGEPPHPVLLLFLITNLVYVCVMTVVVTQLIVNGCERLSERRRLRRLEPGIGTE